MKKALIVLCATVLLLGGFVHFAAATVIDIGDFDMSTATLIDFEDAPVGPIGTYYAGLEFINLNGGQSFDTGAPGGPSLVASNFPPIVPTYSDGEIIWDSAITRVGFYITSNDADDTTLTASLVTNGSIVGSHTFDTGGAGGGGSFVGIEFLAGFDHLLIDTADTVNGAFAIDDLIYEGTPVPEPATMLLLGSGLIGLAGLRRKFIKA